MKKPWIKFYPVDWRGDPRLRMCSLAARGLWADLIGYMHEAEPYGHLLIDGKKPSLADIGALIGRPKAEVTKAFLELGGRGVFSQTDDGVVFSRRMVRDHERSEEGRRQVEKRGGNWSPKSDPNRSGDRGGTEEPITLEARGQKLGLEASEAEPASPPSQTKPQKSNSDYDFSGEVGEESLEIPNELLRSPKQGAKSKCGRFIYFKRGTSEFNAYSLDYREGTGDEPQATADGRWFKIMGEVVTPLIRRA